MNSLLWYIQGLKDDKAFSLAMFNLGRLFLDFAIRMIDRIHYHLMIWRRLLTPIFPLTSTYMLILVSLLHLIHSSLGMLQWHLCAPYAGCRSGNVFIKKILLFVFRYLMRLLCHKISCVSCLDHLVSDLKAVGCPVWTDKEMSSVDLASQPLE